MIAHWGGMSSDSPPLFLFAPAVVAGDGAPVSDAGATIGGVKLEKKMAH